MPYGQYRKNQKNKGQVSIQSLLRQTLQRLQHFFNIRGWRFADVVLTNIGRGLGIDAFLKFRKFSERNDCRLLFVRGPEDHNFVGK